MALIVGGLLAVTGALKLFDVAAMASFQLKYNLPYWLPVIAGHVELGVALLLFTGWKPQISWLIAVGLFLSFSLVSLYRALAGFESCGCFGPLRVNPWATLTLDLAIGALLLGRRGAFVGRQPIRRPAIIVGTVGFTLISGVSLFLIVGSAPLVLRAQASAGNEKLVVLNPKEWIGEEFPLAPQISPVIDLSSGNWIVLLYHSNCTKCLDALLRYERLARGTIDSSNQPQILFLAIPPHDAIDEIKGRARYAQLSADREWFVQTPIEIQLSDGRVTLASEELPSIPTSPAP